MTERMLSVVMAAGAPLLAEAEGDLLGLGVLLRHLVAAAVFAGMGLVIFGLSVWVLNRCLPFSLRKELEEDQNVAVGAIVGGMLIGVAIIIAAAIAG
jgi:putative membrane protein